MNKKTPLSILIQLAFCILIYIPASHAQVKEIQQTQTELKALNHKIQRLEKALSNEKNKRNVIDKELEKTDKKIGETVKSLHDLRIQLNKKQIDIINLEQKIQVIKQQLESKQSKMAEHLRTQYKIGQYQPLKWLLNQQDPNEISQLLTYYQYLIDSQKRSIAEYKQIKNKLDQTQNDLSNELKQHKSLEQSLASQKKQLLADKAYQVRLLQKLQKQIANDQTTLAQFQKNKLNLTKLLETLAHKSRVTSSLPFVRMKHKLPLPVNTQRKNMAKLNQGVMFFSREGDPVDSVYPGKVVFSDWLRGYGLLMIIDHGKGYMTLYAHNQSLFKKKGDIVEQGEQIATVGHSGGIKQNGLYFEIRHRGKAISPLNWLS